MMLLGSKWPCRRGHIGHIKLTFSEYGHDAYQIKGNEAYSNMLANILHLHTYQKSIFFSESSHVAYQIKENEA